MISASVSLLFLFIPPVVSNGGHVDQAPKSNETSCGYKLKRLSLSNQLIAVTIAVYIGFVIFGSYGH